MSPVHEREFETNKLQSSSSLRHRPASSKRQMTSKENGLEVSKRQMTAKKNGSKENSRGKKGGSKKSAPKSPNAVMTTRDSARIVFSPRSVNLR
eukprot:gb/GEZN01017007.1/.p2 GENE.gb/GEZN01017007.1/~~gb/GEZN01017007.1/.p2  ORF type:complete len:101 (+),score=19.92 gb/GEZN01017007.1/:24-305(+)